VDELRLREQTVKIKNKLNQKHVFLTCAIIAFLFLSCTCCSIVGISIKYDAVSPGDGISLFNLLVDIVIGIFTVWGLFWAASEFTESAVKPVIQLFPGKSNEPVVAGNWGMIEYSLMKKPPFFIPGWYETRNIGGTSKRLPNIACGLWLENEQSKAGRFVRVVVRILSTPAPFQCVLVRKPLEKRPESGQEDPQTDQLTLEVQLEESLAVYQTPVYIGELT
jgi:hypothetical protein